LAVVIRYFFVSFIVYVNSELYAWKALFFSEDFEEAKNRGLPLYFARDKGSLPRWYNDH
jgi:hypothetical protein